jgi:dUTP pyrophosphatase
MAHASPSSSLSAQPPILRVRRLSDAARVPARATAFAAGYDLCSAVDIVVPATGRVLVATQIAIAVPSGHYARIAPRSGLALKGVDVAAGVVDEDYRGEVKVLLCNVGATDFAVACGDRIAQLILERISTPPVEVVDTLEDTARGSGGFGSTGISSAATAAAVVPTPTPRPTRTLFDDNDCWTSQIV